jgi:uncharacterized membrane protein
MGLMAIWWILGFAVLAALAWAFLRVNRGGGASVRESPEQILKRRYAGGEIDRETYQRMVADVRRQGGRDGSELRA